MVIAEPTALECTAISYTSIMLRAFHGETNSESTEQYVYASFRLA